MIMILSQVAKTVGKLHAHYDDKMCINNNSAIIFVILLK